MTELLMRGVAPLPDAAVPVDASRDAAPQRWCIITPEYPPLPGEIGDHTALLARALVQAGDTVDVWIPPGPAPQPQAGVTVHVLPSQFGLDALRVLHRTLRGLDPDVRVLVQYSPAAFGMRRLNVAFALLLYAQRARGIDVYFHHGGYSAEWRRTPRRAIGAAVHRLMTWLAVRGARRVYVAVPEWQRHLRRLGVRENHRDRVVTWVPVPSQVPDQVDDARVRAIRQAIAPRANAVVIGHYGRFGAFHRALLPTLVTRLLDDGAERVMLLVGYGGGALRDAIAVARPDLAHRIAATGHVDPAEVSAHLAACDVLVQPYEEGASARRTSLMAGLALGCPIVSNRGRDTGAIWTMRHPVLLAPTADATTLAQAVRTLLGDPALRASLGAEGRLVHEELFSLSRGVMRLRSTVQAVADEVPVEPEPEPLPEPEPEPSPVAPRIVPTGSPRVLLVTGATLASAHRARGAGAEAHQLANALVDVGAAVTVAAPGLAPDDARYAHHAVGRGTLALAALPFVARRLRLNDQDVVHSLDGRWIRTGSRPLVRDAIAGGVDVERYRPGPPATHPRVLFIGALHGAGRGQWLHDLFIDEILPRRPDAELHLVADAAPPSHPRVRFEVLTPSVDFNAALRAARVHVAPATHHSAGAGMLEAMAAGVPVLATPTRGAIELLGNGRFGVLADDSVFAEALLRLLDDDAAERRQIAEAGRARAEVLSWPSVGLRYRELYEERLYAQREADNAPRPARLVVARAGASRGLAVASRHLLPGVARAFGERDLWRAFARLAVDASTFIDVGAGDGTATLHALARAEPAVRRAVAFEPDAGRRETLRAVLAANGFALDPRLEVRSASLGAGSMDGLASLDDEATALESPLFVRMASPASALMVLAGASATLARQGTRWLVAVDALDIEAVDLLFKVKGYRVEHLRTRWPSDVAHWIAASRG